MQEVTLFATCVNELPRQKERVLLLRQCRNRTAITRWNSCIAWFRLVPKVAMYYFVLRIGNWYDFRSVTCEVSSED